MMQAVVSNPQTVTASPWAACRPRRGSVRVRSTRNGAADNLDHLRRPPTATARQPRQQGNGNPAPRRRVIQTTPFGLWDSFPDARTLDQMMRTMERIMDEEDDDGGRRPFVVPGATTVSRSPTERRADDRRGRSPWEIKERAGDYLVRFDMPGMSREDVRVSVQDRTLVVVAEKAAKQGEAAGEDGNVEEGEEEEPWPAASYGRYRTRVELPENVEVERIAAEVRDGVLYLTIPKVSPSGGKVVSIQVQ
ncbi:small heat shock protein, chloroplastic-like [Hordeum vulgare subsp. vulgare]|uniref:SHSP domain-containing protein n=1 Tax=Hordeum vulgare subsp. vulgare TaxID=112509 RepID=A0A8I6XGN8_HORVV|nr:small heat shock protein, chloroplastic-like [Hordeum vulgare subsp. vulgare]